MLPFGLQLKSFQIPQHFPISLEKFDLEREKQRDYKVFGVVKIKQDSKKNKGKKEKRESKKNVSMKQK